MNVELKYEDIHFLRYLGLLGIEKRSPDFEYLKEIVKAHVSKIPFENISKLYYKRRINLKKLIDFELFLNGIEKYGFGGTCYANNFYLNQLLSWLGYNIKLCGASMKDPDVHIVNIVHIDDCDFLVDMGYAAPFFEPLPLNLLKDHTIYNGNDIYVLKPQNKSNQHQIELYRNGDLIHGYMVNPKARNIDEFRQVIEESFEESSTFMNALLLARFNSDIFIVINNMSVIESSGKVSKKYSIDSIEQLSLVINKYFNIPGSIVMESISKLQMQRDGWS